MSINDKAVLYHLVFKRKVTREEDPQTPEEFLQFLSGALTGQKVQSKSAVLDRMFGSGNWQTIQLLTLGTRSFLSKTIVCELIVAATRNPTTCALDSRDCPVRIERVNIGEISADINADFKLYQN